jgi:hypothetical protein
MGHIGRFAALPGCDLPLQRDQFVVIQTHRGIELGEILVPAAGMSTLKTSGLAESMVLSSVENVTSPLPTDWPHLMRPAEPEDLILKQLADEQRPSRFALCQRILQEGGWPLELIDVEPLLKGNVTVLHYLGPHQFDVRPLRAWFRMACDLEVVPEPFGIDPESDLPDWMTETEDEEVVSTCGNCDCGADGCAAEPVTSGCAPAAHGGCASCGISRLRTARR